MNNEILFNSASEIAAMAKGVTYLNNSTKPVTSVVISSKDAVAGSLFVALSGTRADGHDYISDAVSRGAVAVLAEESQTYKCMLQLMGKPCSLILVKDTLKGLQELARSHVSRFNAKIVGITGSCGKTTTKEIIASILSVKAPTAKTPGNFNSLCGLPLSVFSLNRRSRYGVFELGVDHVGEMDTLNSIVKPAVAILTNVCSSHLEKFGNIRALVDEKKKIFTPDLEHAYISEDCHYKNYIIKDAPVAVTQFGVRCTGGLDSVINLGLNGWFLKYRGVKMHLNCMGWHSLLDCICAITVATDMGCTPMQIAEGVAKTEQISGRSKVYNGEITVIDDSYNANYESSYAIIDAVQKIHWKGRKNLALGSMKELGTQSVTAHRKIGEKIGTSGVDNVFLYGKEMEEAYRVLRRGAFRGNLVYSDNFEEIRRDVSQAMRSGDLFLLKGSRAMQMERLLPTLLRR